MPLLTSIRLDIIVHYAGAATPLSCRVSIRLVNPRFYVSTSKSIIKALINMHSFEIQLSPIG
ncbi:hypothetical protein DWA47_05525 [Klebsiella pneumoniae]|nr:hypothetical protein DWA47_05525 [Klebsiella pneumoniae]